MIRDYNRRQILLGCLNLFASLLACAATYGFFRIVLHMVGESFHLDMSPVMQSLAALALLVVVIIAGIVQWKRGQGHEEYADSALNVQLEWVSGGAYMMEHYAQRVTGPAYVLSQLFLSGPLQLMKGISKFRSLIKPDAAFEARLVEMLGQVRLKKTWHPVVTYAGREKELSALISMDRLEYSPRKGTVRTKDS